MLLAVQSEEERFSELNSCSNSHPCCVSLWISSFQTLSSFDFVLVSLGYGVMRTVQGVKTDVVQCSYDDHFMVSSFSLHTAKP